MIIKEPAGIIDMNLSFQTKKLRKFCEESKEAIRKYGSDGGRRLISRVNELQAADNLATMRALPQARLHSLSGNREGQWALDLQHPYRLIVVPIDYEDLSKPETITGIMIVEIEDYH